MRLLLLQKVNKRVLNIRNSNPFFRAKKDRPFHECKKPESYFQLFNGTSAPLLRNLPEDLKFCGTKNMMS